MRWYVIKTLWYKELLRHSANRGGIFLVVLLMLASLMLSIFGGEDLSGSAMLGSVKRCYVYYQQNDAFVTHLRTHVPEHLERYLIFQPIQQAKSKPDGAIWYIDNTGGIEIRNEQSPKAKANQQVYVLFVEPGKGALSAYELWFWQESCNYLSKPNRPSDPIPGEAVITNPTIDIQTRYEVIKGGFDPRAGFATALMIFGIFFICVYLMPSLNCEERERGVLLAQALSPASAWEILLARFLFYATLAFFLGIVLAGAYKPTVLLQPIFWAALFGAVAGSMGVGLTIASLARNQRTASMGALAYMFVITLFIFVCDRVGLSLLNYLSLEFHTPRMLHAVLTDDVTREHVGHVAATWVLAAVWLWVAVYLFRKRGWQT